MDNADLKQVSYNFPVGNFFECRLDKELRI